jgi:SPP1 gp7 family putative phage head morphogenesis protein
MYRSDVLKLLTKYQGELANVEKETFLSLAQGWGTIEKALAGYLTELSKLEVKTSNQLYKDSIYKAFLSASKQNIAIYSQVAAGSVSNAQLKAFQLSQAFSSDFLQASFVKLPVNKINNFIGLSREGTPLYNLLMQSYPETTVRLTDTLLKGIALGKNPRIIAKELKLDMNGNLDRALRIARTEMNNVFRDTNLLEFQKSGVVKEWEWIAEDNACDICAENNGKHFSLDTSFDTHPNCRCAPLELPPEKWTQKQGEWDTVKGNGGS